MNELTAWLICLAALLAMTLQLVRARRSKARRGFHAIVALVSLSVAGLYAAFATEVIPAPSALAGHYVRPLVGLLMLILAAYAVAYWDDDDGH